LSLPGVSVRKDELTPIVEILQSEDYDSPEKMARAILQQAYESFSERDWWVVAMRNEGFNILYGLHGTEGAAQKALEKNELGLMGTCGVFEVHSAKARQAYVKEVMSLQPDKRFCKTCGHSWASHGVRKSNPGCVGKKCGCAQFEKEGSK
jgi:hypothetical protein